ncbi:MAG TPA: prolyl oligopeptidase family serine peptidase, partial [Methylomirabilota bacterium]|nr:prolyl oligopeptidase family serine peptidase [Methylomirabilota bacterium]
MTRLLLLLGLALSFSHSNPLEAAVTYPKARKAEVVEDYHGTKIADPYRWLEDSDSPETRAWIEAQNKLTQSYLASIPEREAIEARLTEIWNYERIGVPSKESGRYFFFKNTGLQNQSVLLTQPSLTGKPQVLLDPNQLSPDGTIALSTYSVSEDGKLMAYAISRAGSDWQEFKVRDVATAKDLSDELRWAKFTGAAWTHDNKGFFYSRFDEPDEKTKFQAANYNQKLYYHQVGKPQSEDKLVYQRPDQKEWKFWPVVSEDGKYLVVAVTQGTDPRRRVFYKSLAKADAPMVELLNEFDAAYDYIGNDGTKFWFHTDLKAPRGKIIEIDIDKPARENWKDLIPETQDTIEAVSVVGDHFVVVYLKDAYNQVRLHDLTGKPAGVVDLPGIGTVSGFSGKRKDRETFYGFTSFTMPARVYRYDFAAKRSELFFEPKVKFDPSGFETKQVFFKSKDGTRVPMFITHRRGLKLDGTNPTLLYGYGGFNIPVKPSFSSSVMVWLEMGGIYAMPNLRGGGEYGEEWHKAGTKLQKQNVFDDFIAAAEWLVANKYTSPEKLAIHGRSNGGLLVGAAMTQRPDLFGAALPAVGVMDMLRFHKFTVGWGWTSDYGSPDNPEEFKALRAYSPLHNLKPGTSYPATMVTTADHDDRVVPAHSFKFAAALQE